MWWRERIYCWRHHSSEQCSLWLCSMQICDDRVYRYIRNILLRGWGHWLLISSFLSSYYNIRTCSKRAFCKCCLIYWVIGRIILHALLDATSYATNILSLYLMRIIQSCTKRTLIQRKKNAGNSSFESISQWWSRLTI